MGSASNIPKEDESTVEQPPIMEHRFGSRFFPQKGVESRKLEKKCTANDVTRLPKRDRLPLETFGVRYLLYLSPGDRNTTKLVENGC